MRIELLKDASETNFEENFVKEIVIVAKEMGGWTIDYILSMPILRYGAVKESLVLIQDEQKREAEQSRGRQTFR